MPRHKRDVPWLEQRGGQYYAHWYDAAAKQTRRLSLRTADAGQAQSRFAAFLVAGAAVTGAAPSEGLVVRQAVDDYLREHVAEKVVDTIRQEGIAEHLIALLGERTIASLTIQDSRDYKLRRNAGHGAKPKRGVARPVTDSTVRRELVMLVAAINHAVRWKRLARAAAPPVELPPEGEGSTRWLTHEELQRLRRAASGRVVDLEMQALDADTDGLRRDYERRALMARRVRDFIEIAYYTGSRREAVERLTKFQVNLETKRIALALPGERKTKKRRPVVPIDPQLMPTIRRCYETSPTEYLLVNKQPVLRGFARAVADAGLGDDVTPHTLRHTRATHLLQAGATPWAVANLLGDTLATVDRVYGHHAPSYLAGVLDRQNEDGA